MNHTPEQLAAECTELQQHFAILKMNAFQALICLNGLIAAEGLAAAEERADLVAASQDVQRMLHAVIQPGPAVQKAIARQRTEWELPPLDYRLASVQAIEDAPRIITDTRL